MADGHKAEDQAKFREMLEGTKEDWDFIVEHSKHFNKGLAKRVLDHLKLLDGDYRGFPVDRLTHSLQTATRAHRDGRDEEYVVCALLHDIGKGRPEDHSILGAQIVRRLAPRLGLNAEELADNPQLAERIVHLDDGKIDSATNTRELSQICGSTGAGSR